MHNMRPTFLKASSLEPNFSFASPTITDSTVINDDPSHTPDSAEANSQHSDYVLHKVDPNLFNYKGSCAEGLSITRVVGGGSVREKLSEHCRSKWGLYVIIAFGLISISGCIAAGMALSAVQPHLVDIPLESSVSAPKPVSIVKHDPSVADANQTNLNLLTRILSTIREAGMQETSLELRNVTETPHQTGAARHSNSTEMADAIVQNDSPSVYVMKPTEYEKPSLPLMNHPGVEKMFSPYLAPRMTLHPSYHGTIPRVFENHDYDRFLDGGLIMSDPKYHDLNITFDDPFRPPQMQLRRSFARRSASYINGQTKRYPIIKIGRFTMMQTTSRTPEPAFVEVVGGTTVSSIEPKALIPEKSLDGCAAGFERNAATHQCADVDECLQMGIRACGVNSECTNTLGSFSCRCSPGFRIDPKSLVCMDIDECKESNGECSPLALCENLPGGFVCKCMEGFYGNGIVCEIDGSGVSDRHDTKPSLPCQTLFPPRIHQMISNPYFPEPFPVLSRYKFCIQKLHSACKTGITLQNFLPSTVSHQEFDYLRVSGKVFTGTDLNGQTMWFLDSRTMPLEIEFSTDSDIKGNRFTLEIVQEICGPILSVPECSELLRIRGKSISSSSPHYIDNVLCTTALYPPAEACGMELNFHEFSLEGPRETCPYDYLEINDDKLCGNMKNELREVIFPRNTPKIPIIFSTDGTFVSKGFNISYTWIIECF